MKIAFSCWFLFFFAFVYAQDSSSVSNQINELRELNRQLKEEIRGYRSTIMSVRGMIPGRKAQLAQAIIDGDTSAANQARTAIEQLREGEDGIVENQNEIIRVHQQVALNLAEIRQLRQRGK